MRRDSMEGASALGDVASLAWPIAIAMLGDTAMGLVDTKLVAGLGAAPIGGVGIGTTLMWLNYSIVFGLMRGVKVRTAHAVGEGRPADGLAYARAGALLGVLAGLAVWAITRDVAPVLSHLGIDPSTIPYASEFLAARTFGAVSICVVSALVQHRQATGDSRTPMLVGLGANLVNAPLAYGMIYGRLGLPALGVSGAGYATAIAETAQMLCFVVLLAKDERKLRRSSEASPSRDLGQAVRDVTSLGVPTGLQFGLETLAFTTFTAILGSLGAHEIAAHQIALAIVRTSFLPGLAVSESASVLVGRALGKRNLAEAHRVTVASLGLAVGFMAACGIVFATAGGALARQFSRDADVAQVAARLLLVAAVFQALDAATIVLRGALRGAKDVRVVAAIGIAVAWSCIPTAAYLFGKLLGWGALGGWLGFVAETALAATLYWRRWARGPWRAAYAANPSDGRQGALAPANAV